MLRFFITAFISLSLLFNILPQLPDSSNYLPDFSKIKKKLVEQKNSFVEVHLEEEKFRYYYNGIFYKECDIIAKGNPDQWGGSAAGLYSVISRHRTAYSSVSKVYMPWSIHYYGKYYIHGEPYYPSGRKLISSVSGGCIRLSDKEIKNFYQISKKDLPVLVIDKNNDYYEKYQEEAVKIFPELSSESYLVADLGSGFIFASKDEDKILPIASITKLMTAVVVAENVDLRRYIKITSKMLEAYGSTKGLSVGKQFRSVELFFPLLIESSNDAAEVLSYFLGREKTIKLMNEKARSIMMEDSEFVDPSGFSPNNKSCARDLFYLARYILNNRPPILKITKGEESSSFSKNKFAGLKNRNFFSEEEDFIGGKTGYLVASGYCGLFIFRFSVEKDAERDVAIIILGAEKQEKGEDSLKVQVERVIDWLEDNYFDASSSSP